MITTQSSHSTSKSNQTFSQKARSILKVVLLGIIVYLGINLVTLRVVVDGGSMESTLASGQLLLVSRVHYQWGEPRQGDIIVFNMPNMTTQYTIKRIIGLPGDTIEFREGRVYINGRLQDEHYLAEGCDTLICPNSIWQIGMGEYFVMGDNRNQSRDSRSFGAIPEDAIIGKAIIRYWPFAEFLWLH